MPVTLTIVTATYNRGHVIKNCLDSVLNQKFKDIEHLIIDNMSSDTTQVIVEEYIKKADYTVRHIRESDSGIYNAFNKGIRLANGEWIHFLSSDDKYYNTELLNEIFAEDNQSYDLLACAIIRDDIGLQDYMEPHFDKSLNHFAFPHPGTLIKRQFLIDNGCYKETKMITSDSVFNLEHYEKAKYKLFNSPLVLMSTGGISSKFNLSYLLEIIDNIWIYRKVSVFKKMKITFAQIVHFFIYGLIRILSKNRYLELMINHIIKMKRKYIKLPH